MERRKPTKADIIAALQRIGARDSQVSQKLFKNETGWGMHWFDRHWPIGGYQAACEEAGVKRGAIIGTETHLRISDEDIAIRFADAVRLYGRIPPLPKFASIARIGTETVLRGEKYKNAKQRIILAYFDLPEEQRLDSNVAQILRDELDRLNGKSATAPLLVGAPPLHRHAIQIPAEYIALVREFRERGEEEKRQLVANFFHDILGYKRSRVRSEHESNDVRVHDRRDRPWLVVEVKPNLETGRHKRAARRQGFDYAHRIGMRFVVISDADFYEIYDRCAGQRLRYDEMRQGSFHISASRQRDSDLLSLLASER
jgi:hypothetical protein